MEPDDERIKGVECVLAFDTDDPVFARGFEAGRLWATLQGDPDARVEEAVHATNSEMALRMAESLHRRVTGEQVDETWTLLRYTPAGE